MPQMSLTFPHAFLNIQRHSQKLPFQDVGYDATAATFAAAAARREEAIQLLMWDAATGERLFAHLSAWTIPMGVH